MKDFWDPIQMTIKNFCATFDNKWQIRKRIIDTHLLVLFIFKLILSKNKQGYKSILNELWEKQELITYKNSPPSSSSLCDARQKLPEEVFTELNTIILSNLEKTKLLQKWHEHRIFAADGSKINLPRELLSLGYEAPQEGQHYPLGLMSTIYCLGDNLVYDCLLKSKKSERDCIIEQMDKLSPGDILVLDRGYFSYLLLYKAVERNIHLICRLQFGTMNKEIKAFCESNLRDSIINYYPSKPVKRTIEQQGYRINYKDIKLRLVKYRIGNEVYVCATTLVDKGYLADEFPLVYHGRWGIEELYKISKEFINVEDFHSKTERGIKQELYAHVLLINIARIFEIEANNQFPPKINKEDSKKKINNVKESYWQDFCEKIQKYKINFKNCLLVIARYIEKLIIPIEEIQANWVYKILINISGVRQKIRTGRHYPRRSMKPSNKWRNTLLSKKGRKKA